MIITDEAILRTPCVDALPEEVAEIITALEKELQYSAEMGRPGIGLCAPQIGIHKKVAIIRIPVGSAENYNINLVNCRIKEGYKPSKFTDEGCLSFPGESYTTTRYQEVYVVDNMVEPYSFIATGILGICVQHEIDHYNGILLTDRKI